MRKITILSLALALASSFASCSKDDDAVKDDNSSKNQPEQTAATLDEQINDSVYKYLSSMYLWNDEYRNQKLDFTKGYEDFFYDGLMSMTTNTLDNRKYTDVDGKTYHHLFSYIEKLPDISSSTRATEIDKEKTYNFGITGLLPVGSANSEDIYFFIQGIYPDSPAEKAGLRRGMAIKEVNGQTVTTKNYEDLFYQLVTPSSPSTFTLSAGDYATEQFRTASIASEAMYCNPIIYHKVTTEDETPNHRVGYLVYAGFDAGFDEELFSVFKEFKQAGITDLIIDLRYNGGGHTTSANLISTCIAGDQAKDKVFMSLRYNEERMRRLNGKREDEYFYYDKDANLGTSLAPGILNMSHVYVLTGSGTASASELVINALRGIDVQVTLIGERTTGKNVGMEYDDKKIKDGTYRIVPITFQSYNAKGESDYEGGFEPDIEVDENDPASYGGWTYDYYDYGTMKDPLYARAICDITGMPIPDYFTRRTRAITAKSTVLKAPKTLRTNSYGMLRRAK